MPISGRPSEDFAAIGRQIIPPKGLRKVPVDKSAIFRYQTLLGVFAQKVVFERPRADNLQRFIMQVTKRNVDERAAKNVAKWGNVDRFLHRWAAAIQLDRVHVLADPGRDFT